MTVLPPNFVFVFLSCPPLLRARLRLILTNVLWPVKTLPLPDGTTAFFCTTTRGHLGVYVFTYTHTRPTLTLRHQEPVSRSVLTDVDLLSEREEVTVCTENGTLHCCTAAELRVVRVIRAQECGVFHAVCYVTSHTVAVGSVQSCHLFDERMAAERPVQSLVIPWSEPAVTHVTSLAVHPDRRHIIATGTSRGSVLVHDLREGTSASSGSGSGEQQSHRWDNTVVLSHSAHHGPVHEVAFFLSKPSHLLSLAHDGTLLLWDLNREGHPYRTENSLAVPQTSASAALRQLVATPVPLLAFDYHTTLNTIYCTAENDALIFAFNTLS
jgi:WD40 repeat protein